MPKEEDVKPCIRCGQQAIYCVPGGDDGEGWQCQNPKCNKAEWLIIDDEGNESYQVIN